jgi:branched-chain amino acid transport system substrate-binding protein
MARRLVLVPVAVSLAVGIAACGSTGSSGSGDGPIVLGADVSLTGPLSPFGATMRAGYERAVQEANAQGGIMVGGKRRKVVLDVLDDRSDPTTAGDNARTLALKSNATILFGPASPPLTLPVAQVAEREKVPALLSFTPLVSFHNASKSGWKYTWDTFVNEPDLINAELSAAATQNPKSNRKLAIFADTEQDGQVFSRLWHEQAPALGLRVAYTASFPAGTSDLSSFVAKAKQSGADVVAMVLTEPDTVSLYKEMKAQGYHPKVVIGEKGTALASFQRLLGPLANGTVTMGFWAPELGYPQGAQLESAARHFGGGQEVSNVVDCYSLVQVGLKAIERAGSTDPDKVNAAIAQTSGVFPLGPIRFRKDHSAVLKVVMKQWQDAETRQVYPKGPRTSQMAFPMPGLS